MDMLLIDDHLLLCEALALLIAAHHPQMRLRVAGTLSEGLALGRTVRGPLLVLLDLSLPDASGVQAVPQVLQALPQARVVVVSADDRPETVHAVMALGGSGFVSKTADLRRLQQALMDTLDGRMPLPPSLMAPPAAAAAPVGVDALLTPRQLDVLRLLVAASPTSASARRCSCRNPPSRRTWRRCIGAWA